MALTTHTLAGAAGSACYEGRLDADAAIAFALATNDPNDRYLCGDAVPPLFTSTLMHQSNWEEPRRGMDLVEVRGGRAKVHGGHDVYFWGSVQPGTTVQWSTTFHGARQTPAGVVVTQRVLVSDCDGVPLVEHFWSGFHIGAAIDADLGSAPVDHSFPEDARTRQVASRTITVDRDQAFRYAGVSGDHVGHAIDDEVARREGYPSKILQGLCTFGLCSGAVVDSAADGDPGLLRRLAGRFSAPAFPGRDLVIGLYDAGRTADGGRVFAFEAIQDGVTVIKHGRVELVPD